MGRCFTFAVTIAERSSWQLLREPSQRRVPAAVVAKHATSPVSVDTSEAEHIDHGEQTQQDDSKSKDPHAEMVADFKRRFWISLLFTIPIVILSPMLQGLIGLRASLQFSGDAYVLWGLSSVIFFYGGFPFLKVIFYYFNDKRPGMMTLIAVAISTAYLYSSAVAFGLQGKVFFWELATLIDIMLLGHWIEMKSVMGASHALEALAKLMPTVAHRISKTGEIQDVPVSNLQGEDQILVKPGEKIPADGDVVEGQSSVNESMLTGESKPITKIKGAKVIGGGINGEGSLTIIVKKTGGESYLNQVIELVRKAQESKSHTQDIANQAAFVLTVVALGSGTLTLLLWLGLSHQPFSFALERMVTVMVITCPHALGLAVPLVVAVSTTLAAGNGLLIRNRAAFERSRNIQAIIFDKTGTLTQGRFGVTDTILFDKTLTRDKLLELAASVESHSEHPIAKAIAGSVKLTPVVTEFKAIPGKGAQGKSDGKLISVVSPGYLRENHIDVPGASLTEIDTLSEQGKTVIYVLSDGKLSGAIALADLIRPESKEAVTKLKAAGIRCMMLTGDNKKVAAWVAKEIGLDEVFSEVLPQQKSEKIKEVQARGLVVAMTGDGVNDAPALAQADVGIAIGAGSDVAIETADIILVRSNPMDVVAILGLARATYKKMIQNLVWATGYNAFAIPLAAGALYSYGIVLSPAMGAGLMALSTVIVAINARRLHLER
jgi:Cu2+-exporting ATPase